MKKLLIVALCATMPMSASAQNAVTQDGTVQANKPTMWSGDRRVRQGAGEAGGPAGRMITGGFGAVGKVCSFSDTTDKTHKTVCLNPLGSIDVDGQPVVLPGSITGLIQVANNAALLAVGTDQSNTIFRAGFYAPGDGGDGWYTLSASPCALASGNGDSGSQVKASNGNCWIGIMPPLGWRPEQFGAVADGTTNVAASVQAAANAAAGKRLNFGARFYCVSSPINIPDYTHVEGVGRMDRQAKSTPKSGLRACAQNMSSIIVLNSGSYLGNLYINGDYSGVNTSGSAIRFATSPIAENTIVSNVWVDGSCIGVEMAGNTVTLENTYINGQQGTGCGGVRVGEGTTAGVTVDTRLKSVTTSANSSNQPDFGVSLVNCGGCAIDGYSDFLVAKVGLRIVPGAGQSIGGGFFANSGVGDSNSQYGILIDTGSSTAKVTDLTFTGSWSATAGLSGVLIKNTSAGIVDNISFANHRSFNNQWHGFEIFPGPTNIRISDNQFCNNGQGAGGSGVDIDLKNGASRIQLEGNNHQGICRWSPGAFLVAAGINLEGNNDEVMVSGNSLLSADFAPVIGIPVGNSVFEGNLGIDGAFASASATGGAIALNAVYPRWTIPTTTDVSTITGQWNSRTVTLWPVGGPVSFVLGGNICNAITTAGSFILATYIGAPSNCWLLK